MLVAVVLAVVTAGVIVGIATWVRSTSITGESPAGNIKVGTPAPPFAGTTLNGAPLSLAGLLGRPVIVNFWGPSCIPCRDEFALFKDELSRRSTDAIALVGILMFDDPASARDFVAATGADWPTIDDPGGTIRTAYRAVARPQTYFIDRGGVLRGIQVGQLTTADFDRLYAQISGPASGVLP